MDVRFWPQAPYHEDRATRVAVGQTAVIQAPELGVRIMRYALADHEWTAIKPYAAEQAPWHSPGKRPSGPQRYLLGLTIWSSLA